MSQQQQEQSQDKKEQGEQREQAPQKGQSQEQESGEQKQSRDEQQQEQKQQSDEGQAKPYGEEEPDDTESAAQGQTQEMTGEMSQEEALMLLEGYRQEEEPQGLYQEKIPAGQLPEAEKDW